MGQTDTFLILATLGILALLYLKKSNPRAQLPFPPGPKKLPLLGNLLDLPTNFPSRTYAQWGRDYHSDIIHLSACGNDFIVLNSFKAAMNLCEKRSSIYSSRPQFTMISELMGWRWLMSAMVYGQPWKERRRLFQKYFHPSNAALYQPYQTEYVRKTLPQLLESPGDFLQITRHAIGSVALSLAFGIKTLEVNDPYIKIAENAIASMTEASTGGFLVDVIPLLKHVPAWVPGAGFQKKAKRWHQIQEDFRELPFKATLDDIALGVARPSFTSTALENMVGGQNSEEQIEVIKDTAGIVFAAGADTTLSGIHTFFAAMLCFPETQRKAQEELDHVLQGRLPELGDEKDLPYISALVKEVLRWQPATPIAVPHSASKDDVYEGYHIPQNALVIGNVWAMLHDEEDFPDPSSFKPERFLKHGQLDPSVRDPALISFGFGRRICPGSHIAMSLTWLMAASILSTFNISKAIGEDGVPIEPAVKYQYGLISHPEPFKCTIEPRSKAAERLIRLAAEGYQ